MITVRSALWFGLALGILVPYAAFLPWLWDHGFNVSLFFEQMLTNHISSFFALDVIVSAIALMGIAAYDQTQTGRNAVPVILATMLVGVSAGLPLYLLRRLQPGS